jgi:sigma-B regulation protein RsbU (phosphoserine phosphatase)
VTMARAGHELPLIARRDPATGLVRANFIESDGMALGLVPDEIFRDAVTDHSISFHPDDVLVLYTDGVTEAPNEEGKEFAGARLADAVRGRAARSSKEINDGVLEAVQRFTGETGQRDDFTLVTVKRV